MRDLKVTLDDLALRCRDAHDRGGLFSLLKVLNESTPYRFTGVYRFEGRWVKSVWLYDREHPNIQFGSDVRWDESYCRLTAGDGEFCEIIDSLADPRLTNHAARETVQCYVAVALKLNGAVPVGTLCHYDVQPRTTPPGVLEGLRAVRPLVEQALVFEAAGVDLIDV